MAEFVIHPTYILARVVDVMYKMKKAYFSRLS